MSVIGIDFGAQSTKIGVARNKGIDIVRIFACPSKRRRSLDVPRLS
jgi:sugar (pentulose or hexulose) kinase